GILLLASASWTRLPAPPPVRRVSGSMQARKVLIVDDDPSVRKSLRRLVQAAGYVVEVFAGAREYLAQAAAGGQACLVLDVRMPEVSGLELMGMVAGTALARPVVLITGHGD